VRYCVWDPNRSTFCELRNAQLDVGARSEIVSAAVPVLGIQNPVGKRAALRSIGKGLRDLTPAGLRSLAPHLLRLGERLTRITRRIDAAPTRIKAWLSMNERAPQGSLGGCLHPGDVLVTLGQEWETGFMPFLGELQTGLDIRILGCCHDLIPIRYPQYCPRYVADQFRGYLAQMAQSCSAIACVSERSLNDLRDFFSELRIPAPRLFRIRLGSNLPIGDDPPSRLVSDVTKKPYVLFVSTLERRKNHEVLYRAFRRLAERHGQDRLPRLVFVGALGWGVADLLNDMELDPFTRGVIAHLQNVSDNDLRILYQQALFCVFPSLYEGWGLPVAEALGFGKPVLCSNRGALPEVGGALVEYVDPWDLPGWVSAIERLWLDAEYRKQLADRIAREHQPDDWKNAAATIGQVALALEDGTLSRKKTREAESIQWAGRE
jgi:glycosyltransferase involved in cell wall biosynthesis